MRAMIWNGVNDIRVERVRDPSILNRHDAIVRVHLSSVCGSDLHLLHGFVPGMKAGDIIGHEFVGEVVAVGPGVQRHRAGDRVVVSSVIGCGSCFHCVKQEYSLCDNSNTNGAALDEVYGHGGAAIFGYSHLFGGYAGSHAEFVRVPFADHGAITVPDELSDEQVLFCSDAFPTGFMGADLAEIEPGDTVAIWGCGAVGQMAILSAWLLGAGRVIAIDRYPERLEMARRYGRAEVIDYSRQSVPEVLDAMTGGRGPDRCIEAVGMEAQGRGLLHAYDQVAQAVRFETDRPTALREAIYACRKGGTVSIMGVFAGFVDKFPLGAAMNKGLRLHMGQMHGQKYIPRLLEYVREGRVDPRFLITHRWPLERGAEGYDMFAQKTDGCQRVVFDPRLEA